jgi:hypothetical protein
VLIYSFIKWTWVMFYRKLNTHIFHISLVKYEKKNVTRVFPRATVASFPALFCFYQQWQPEFFLRRF